MGYGQYKTIGYDRLFNGINDFKITNADVMKADAYKGP